MIPPNKKDGKLFRGYKSHESIKPVSNATPVSDHVVKKLEAVGKFYSKEFLNEVGAMQGMMGETAILAFPMKGGSWHCVRYETYPAEPRFLNAPADGNGKASLGLLGLEGLNGSTEVWATEGVWDFLMMRKHGFPVVGLPGVNNFQKKWVEYFKDKIIHIVFDNDAPGHEYAKKHSEIIATVAKEIRVYNLPSEFKGKPIKDISDLFNADVKEAKKWLAEHKPEIIENPFGKFEPVTSWLKTEPPPRRDIFKGLLPRGIVGLVVAEGGTGKSYLLKGLSLSAAAGKPFFKLFHPTSDLRVLAFFAEDSPEHAHRRFHAIAQEYGEELDYELINKNLRIVCNTSWPLLELDRKSNPQTTAFYNWLERQVEEFKPDLIIFDPLVEFSGLDENNNSQAAQFIRMLRKFTEGGASILLNHHENKVMAGSMQQNSARGATAFPNGCRFVMNLKKMTEADAQRLGIQNPTGYIELQITKNSYAPRLPESAFFRIVEGGGLQQVEVRDLGENRMRRIVEALGEAVGERELSSRDILKEETGNDIRRRLKRDLGAVQSDLTNAIDWGRDNGHITVRGEGTTKKKNILQFNDIF